MRERARHGLETAVGLALLGVQRWMTIRPDVEAELDRLGYTPVADASRLLGETVSKTVTRLVSGPAARPGGSGPGRP